MSDKVKSMNLKDKYIGEWWIDDEEKSIPGELIFNDNKIELYLHGAFKNIKSVMELECEEVNINGYTTCGIQICLINCTQRSVSLSMPGRSVEVYTTNRILFGCNFKIIDEILIDEAIFSLDILKYWIWPNRIINRLDDNTLRLDYPSETCLAKAKLRDYEISIFSQYKTTINKCGDVKTERIHEVNFNYINHIKLKELSDDIHYFIQYLTLCTSHKCCISNLKLKLKITNDKWIDYVIVGNKVNNKSFDRNKILIKFEDISARFEELLKVWEDKRCTLEPVIDYYIDTIDREIFSQVEFLKLIQALEVFSRRLRNNEVINSNDYDRKVRRMLERLEKEDSEWLEPKLKYMNEPILKKRIISLLQEVKFIFNLSNVKIKKYAFKVAETRNYLTHFDESKKNNILSIDEMLYSTKLFEIILKYLILSELGIDKENIKEKIIKNNFITIKLIKNRLDF